MAEVSSMAASGLSLATTNCEKTVAICWVVSNNFVHVKKVVCEAKSALNCVRHVA